MSSFPERRPRRQRGVTLTEVIVSIVIISVALSAILRTLAYLTAQMGNPMIRRQSVAAAQQLIQEIDAVPYHQKDPYNPTGPNDAVGPETGEARFGGSLPFDNPNDYAGYAETGIFTPSGVAVAGLGSYNAAVTAQQQSVGNIPASDGLLVTVNVTAPNGETVSVSSFRAMYAP